jgi:hypothetical protein
VKYQLQSHRTRQRCAQVIRELAVPAPSELGEFRACIERHTDRVLELVPVVMGPNAPSGTWLRTADADYLCYEEQTSPFHQAHIVLSLAAHLLLGDEAGPLVDRRLVPDLSPQLVRLMLGDTAGSTVTHREAETFAFLALEHARPASYPSHLARRALRQLRPLHSALCQAVPEVTSAVVSGIWTAAEFRLHQRIIQIRDAMLPLRPYWDAEVASATANAGCAAGLTGDELAAAVEAAVLAAAMEARSAGSPALPSAGDVGRPDVLGPDLRSETAWLVKVSRAFAELRRGGELAREQARESRPGGMAAGADRDGAWFR